MQSYVVFSAIELQKTVKIQHLPLEYQNKRLTLYFHAMVIVAWYFLMLINQL